jgi:hypothetical protein
MKFFNKVQQLRAHTGGHKGAAILTSGFHQPVVFTAQAASEYSIIRGLFQSAGGNFHGISPEAEGIMTQNVR